MENVKKTFRIPELLLKKWTAALRSGEYQQGRRDLYREANNTYCCLGVLMKVCDGTVKDTSSDSNTVQLPTVKWAKSHGITYLDGISHETFNPRLAAKLTAAMWNDSYNGTFPQIADMLEKYAETY